MEEDGKRDEWVAGGWVVVAPADPPPPDLPPWGKPPPAVAAAQAAAAVATAPEAAAVAAAGEAAAVPSPHGGPCRTPSQREHEEGGEEEDWQPTVQMSCRAGHDHTPEATTVPAARGKEPPEGPVTSSLAPRVPLAMPNDDDNVSARCRHVVSSGRRPIDAE